VTPQPVRPGEISGLIAWAARLSRTRPGSGETAAYLAAKADLLDRIAASREHGGWASGDITAARQAAARARTAAARAASLTMEDQS
jgi:sirohydrochlorin ferrochelatase